MRVLVLYTLPPAGAPPGRTVGEFDVSAAACGVAEALPGAVAVGIRGEAREVIAELARHAPEVVFNVCEAPMGRPDLEPHVAALLEWIDVRFTGSGSETLGLCRRKDRVNALLAAAGVPVPGQGGFPCIVKPADEDGSAGIHAGSVCESREQLAEALGSISGEALVQEFLPGREFAVSLWGAREPEHVSIGEYSFRNGLRLNTYASKWETDSSDFANSPLFYHTAMDAPLRNQVTEAAQAAWRVVGARGYLRVDIRLDAEGRPRVLDVNPNSELSPGVGICRAAAEAGWTWERFVQQQVEWALRSGK
jgi:D-alanine-D-alanine ligase